jgi:hypothetical protein
MLAHLQGHQRTERVLVRAQGFTAQAHRFAAPRRRRRAPDLERGLCALDDGLVVGVRAGVDARNDLVGAGIDRLEHTGIAGGRPLALAKIGAGIGLGQTEGGENRNGHEDSRERCGVKSRA